MSGLFETRQTEKIWATGFRKERESLGVSLREVARRAGVSATFLSNVERQKYPVSREIMERIVKSLDDASALMPPNI